jgi:hypothetical protein
MTRILRLYPHQATIVGKYTPGDSLICLCDATNAAFVVALPDARMAGLVDISLMKIDGSANAVTIQTRNEQTINGSETASLASQYSTASLVPDRENWYNFG